MLHWDYSFPPLFTISLCFLLQCRPAPYLVPSTCPCCSSWGRGSCLPWRPATISRSVVFRLRVRHHRPSPGSSWVQNLLSHIFTTKHWCASRESHCYRHGLAGEEQTVLTLKRIQECWQEVAFYFLSRVTATWVRTTKAWNPWQANTVHLSKMTASMDNCGLQPMTSMKHFAPCWAAVINSDLWGFFLISLHDLHGCFPL